MIVLDTHALIWWVSGDSALSKKAKTAINRERENGELVISSISAWEIAMLVKNGRLKLTMEVEAWLSTVASIERTRFIPVDTDIALKAVSLPGEFHKDPADRMIVATARKLAAPVITKDEKIQAYAHVKTIW